MKACELRPIPDSIPVVLPASLQFDSEGEGFLAVRALHYDDSPDLRKHGIPDRSENSGLG
jgi:hypothetical protein